MIYTVSVPLPPETLSPNAKPHWARKARDFADYKSDCIKCFIASNVPKLKCPITLTYVVYTALPRVAGKLIRDGRYRPRDHDNAIGSLKALQDAFKTAGLVPDDGAAYVRLGGVRIVGEKESMGVRGVAVTIEDKT